MISRAAGTHHRSALLASPASGWERGRECSKRQSRRGVTLIELLLVLALLAVIASLAAPVVENSFITMKLRRGGDRVLTAWSDARSRAIRTGDIQQFTYKLDGSEYRVGPWVDATTASGAAGMSNPSLATPGAMTMTPPVAAGSSTAAAGQSGADDNEVEPGELPEKIHFHAGQSVVTRAEDGQREVASLSGSGEAWSTPILFFPDGSASNASVTLATDRKQYQRITLRGLTGVGRASLVLGATELQRLESVQRSVR